MRLGEGVIRELHWHKEAEWAYVLDGSVRVTALDYEGGNFMEDLEKGDLWYFPSGVPHSLQGLSPNGTEFLLVFDDGRFSEESTFILTDWLGKFWPGRSTTSSLPAYLLTSEPSSPHAQVCHCRELPPRPRGLRPPARGREVHLPGLQPRLH